MKKHNYTRPQTEIIALDPAGNMLWGGSPDHNPVRLIRYENGNFY